MQVKDIMTTRVVTVTPDIPVPVMASLLRDNRISGVPVTGAEGTVVGLVSEYRTHAARRRPTQVRLAELLPNVAKHGANELVGHWAGARNSQALRPESFTTWPAPGSRSLPPRSSAVTGACAGPVPVGPGETFDAPLPERALPACQKESHRPS